MEALPESIWRQGAKDAASRLSGGVGEARRKAPTRRRSGSLLEGADPNGRGPPASFVAGGDENPGMRLILSFSVALILASPAWAEKKTVCTITVNSADEKETFRQNLPKDKYQFVELVEKGRRDWLASSCRKGIQCDVLVVSGHFNAGETFYSDSLQKDEYLEVDELERVSCSDSCPGLFSKLKEVYLFGCESLNPDANKYSSSYGESGRERMRRIFANVPRIYGF
jgi:hypothetical protein